MKHILEVEGLSYRLPGSDGAERAALVEDVSFTVGAGEMLALLGRSGAGKSTLLRLINRLLPASAGEVKIGGERAWDVDPIRLRRRIGYVIQEVGLFPHFTVERNVGLVLELDGRPPQERRARAAELLEMVGLPPGKFSLRYPHELSGGERQRVGVARALAADPPLLLLDEPFGALDPITRSEMQREFHTLEGRLRKAMVLVTHDVREALRLGTRIGVLSAGRLVFTGTPDAFVRTRVPAVAAIRVSM